MRLVDITDKLHLRNFTQSTQRLEYILPDGTVDTIEVYPGQRAAVPTENLSTTPSPGAFYYEGKYGLDNPELRTALGLQGGAPEDAPPLFATLTLSNYNVAENTSPGVAIANILGGLTGGEFALVSDGGGRAALNSAKTGLVTGLVNIDYESATFIPLIIRETLRGYSNDTALNLIVTDVNEPLPISFKTLTLSKTAVAENTPITTAVGTIANTSGGALSIVAGNTTFGLTGTTVYPKVVFDFESGVTSYNLTVRETDPNFPSNYRDTAFVITVTNVLEVVLSQLAPTTFNFVDNVASGAVLATLTGRRTGSTLALSTTDKVTLDTATNQIKRASGSVVAGTAFTFTITETFPDAAPVTTTFTATPVSSSTPITLVPLVLSNATVTENNLSGSKLGTLTNVPSGVNLSVTAGGTLVQLSGNDVMLRTSLDFETTPSFQFTVRQQDAGTPTNTRDTTFTVTVTNVLEVTLNALTPATFNFVDSLAQNDPMVTLSGRTAGSTLVLGSTDKVTLDATSGIVRRSTGSIVSGTPFSFSITESFPDAASRTTTFTATPIPAAGYVDFTVAATSNLASPVAQDAVVATITETGSSSRPASIGTLDVTVSASTPVDTVLVTLL